jgi:hypothetical protein
MYLRSLGVYLPEGRMGAEAIAELSGLPVEVVREKLGIREKPVPGPEDHPAEMAAWAAEEALRLAGFPGEGVDWVLSMVEEYLRVLLDPNPWGVKKEGVLWSPTESTPSTILTQKPFWWLPTSGWMTSSRPFRPKASSSPKSKSTRRPLWPSY